MKKIILAAIFMMGLSTLNAVNAQDTTRRQRPKTDTMKKKTPPKQTKKPTRPYPKDSTRRRDSMDRPRRDTI